MDPNLLLPNHPSNSGIADVKEDPNYIALPERVSLLVKRPFQNRKDLLARIELKKNVAVMTTKKSTGIACAKRINEFSHMVSNRAPTEAPDSIGHILNSKNPSNSGKCPPHWDV